MTASTKITGIKFGLIFFTLIIMQHPFGQNVIPFDQLPVNISAAANDTTKPMVLYITGDGGWNKFSKTLCQTLAAKGYPVVSLNAKDYFWKKKTAVQTAIDVARLIRTYQKAWNRKRVWLVGYSFGADVLPFVFNGLPADINKQVVNLSLLSPSTYTDFEIHLTVMFGARSSGGEMVVAAINKITTRPLTLVFGKEENNFPLSQVKIKNYTSIRLDGGHHYDGDEASLCNTIIQHLPKK